MGSKSRRHNVRALDCCIDSNEKDAHPPSLPSRKPQNNLTAEKHWKNAKLKPILRRRDFLTFYSSEGSEQSRGNRKVQSRPIERSKRLYQKERSTVSFYGTLGVSKVSRAPCSIDTLRGRSNRSTLRSRASPLAARTTTIKVVSLDRDVTLPVACRSTFIAVIQPRIERPTAERRNGNTQWFSRELLRNAIDPLSARTIVPD